MAELIYGNAFAGLDEVHPFGPLELIILLEEVSVGTDELSRRDVLHGEEFLFDVAEHLCGVNIIEYIILIFGHICWFELRASSPFCGC